MRAPRTADLIYWVRLVRLDARLVRLIEYGTSTYDRETKRRLKILNVVAYLIALFTLVYAIQQMFVDLRLLAPVILLNLAIVAIALLVPLAHRINDIAGALPRLARMGLAMLQATDELANAFAVPLRLRIGIASGPVMAGVIGAKRLTYDVWGDTVNLASRLEGQSTPGRVLVASGTKARLEGLFQLEPRGAIDIKGLGEEEAWFLGPEVPNPPSQALVDAGRDLSHGLAGEGLDEGDHVQPIEASRR